MSEHAWILENLETYHAGGLEPAERERLEQHTYECPACAQASQEIRGVDHALDVLFADVRPQATLEDRMIQFLRTKPKTGGASWAWVAGAAAAVVLFGVVGAGASHFLSTGELPFPGLVTDREQLASTKGIVAQNYGDTYSYFPYSRDPASDRFQASSTEDKSRVSVQTATRTDTAVLMGKVAKNEPASPALPEIGGIVAGKPTSPAGASMGGMGMGAGMASQMTPQAKEEDRKSTAGEQGKASVEFYYAPQEAAVAGKPAANYYKQLYGYRDSSPARTVAELTDGTSHLKAQSGLHFRPGDAATGWKDGELAQEQGRKQSNKSNSIVQGQEGKEDKASKKGVNDLGHVVADLGAPHDANAPVKNQANTTPHKIVIRSGDIEFEIESFDSAVAAVTKLVTQIKGGYVDTINSEKLANGKVRGTVVVRVPPEALDGLVLDLRKELGRGGELKSLKIGSQDITKQYTDMESRLKAARTMEERLLRIIKDGKGEIKDLLNAEKELGVWRTKIEELE
ncbi:MAG TPA: DUF4349 domain-containing protein, partial [Gemmataceae bacterium]|nr:DUF4349 domain-containing protein [Gemmataceae bacterium]